MILSDILMLTFVLLFVYQIFVYQISSSQVHAISPPFSLQTIDDDSRDWIDWTKKHPFEQDGSIDITRVNYFSDGKTLNATLWLECQPDLSSYRDTDSFCNRNQLILSVKNLNPSIMTLKAYTNEAITELRDQNLNIIESKNTTLAGIPAHKVIYNDTLGQLNNFKALQIWTVKNAKAYILTYTATVTNYAHYLPIIQDMINSFSTLNIQNNVGIDQSPVRSSTHMLYQNSTYGIRISFPSDWRQHVGPSYKNTTDVVIFNPPSLSWVSYGMYIDADNNNKTGMLGGIDYAINFYKDDSDETWTRQIEQWATPTEYRIVDFINNYTGLFGEFPAAPYGKGFVNLSVNLNMMGSPDSYKVIFFAIKANTSNVYDRVGDYTNWALIPPPKIDMKILPNPTEIRQNENNKIGLQLKSNTGFAALTQVSINGTGGIRVNYDSKKIQIPPFGIVTIPITIEAPNNADIGPKSIPISITSSFPTLLFKNNTSYGAFHVGALRFVVPDTNTATLHETSDWTIIVQKQLGIDEIVRNFWGTYGGPIGLIAGGFSGWLFGRFQKSRENKGEKPS
jgi:hypothetical protein